MQLRIAVAAVTGFLLLPCSRSLDESAACGAFGFSSWDIPWSRLFRLSDNRRRTSKRANGSSREDWDEEVLLDMGW